MTRWEKLGMTAEEYVRSRWDFPIIICDGSYRDFAKGTVLINWANHRFYEFGSFDAAATYTADHEEAIRQKREEIYYARMWANFADGIEEHEAGLRILSVLEDQFEGMLKGWKE